MTPAGGGRILTGNASELHKVIKTEIDTRYKALLDSIMCQPVIFVSPCPSSLVMGNPFMNRDIRHRESVETKPAPLDLLERHPVEPA